MERKKMRKKGNVDGVIASIIAEASSLLATIKLNGCNNGKCKRSAERLAAICHQMAEAFKQKESDQKRMRATVE